MPGPIEVFFSNDRTQWKRKIIKARQRRGRTARKSVINMELGTRNRGEARDRQFGGWVPRGSIQTKPDDYLIFLPKACRLALLGRSTTLLQPIYCRSILRLRHRVGWSVNWLPTNPKGAGSAPIANPYCRLVSTETDYRRPSTRLSVGVKHKSERPVLSPTWQTSH